MSLDPFLLLLRSHRVPAPQTEFAFHPTRKFRFDYAWPEALVAVERNGGIWRKGGHSSGLGILRDYEKVNLGQLAGWVVLQYTPQQLALESTITTLKTVLRRAG